MHSAPPGASRPPPRPPLRPAWRLRRRQHSPVGRQRKHRFPTPLSPCRSHPSGGPTEHPAHLPAPRSLRPGAAPPQGVPEKPPKPPATRPLHGPPPPAMPRQSQQGPPPTAPQPLRPQEAPAQSPPLRPGRPAEGDTTPYRPRGPPRPHSPTPTTPRAVRPAADGNGRPAGQPLVPGRQVGRNGRRTPNRNPRWHPQGKDRPGPPVRSGWPPARGGCRICNQSISSIVSFSIHNFRLRLPF